MSTRKSLCSHLPAGDFELFGIPETACMGEAEEGRGDAWVSLKIKQESPTAQKYRGGELAFLQ